LTIRYFITDGHDLETIERAIDSGIEWIQIREKNLGTKDLTALVAAVVAMRHSSQTKILVNDRADIALACGADGVHLRSHSIAPAILRRVTLPDFMIGVSCHTLSEVIQSAEEGASFALFGPIFDVPGKGPPLGLRALAQAVHAVPIPVLALGGITPGSIPACLRTGAAGVAGIRLFRGVE
jgi:thiamine-phosphate pyrophosphorylase